MSDPPLDLSQLLRRHRIVPVLVLDDPGPVAAIAAALVGAGLPLVEVTFRGPRARDVLRRFAAVATGTGLVVGAGTVRTAEQVRGAVADGARFVVSPGWGDDVVAQAASLGVPVLPGVATATEVQRALDRDVAVLKLFPAAVVGGPAAVTALAGPFPDARFVPTGGISEATAPGYLAHPAVLAVGGSWMLPPDAVAAGDGARIHSLVERAVATVSRTGVGS